MSLKLDFQQSSKKPQIGLAAAYSGVARGGRLYFLAAEEDTEKPNIKACDGEAELGR